MRRNRKQRGEILDSFWMLYDSFVDLGWLFLMMVADQHRQQETATDVVPGDAYIFDDLDDQPDHDDFDDDFDDCHSHSPYFSDNDPFGIDYDSY